VCGDSVDSSSEATERCTARAPTAIGQSCECGRDSNCRHRLHLLDCSRLGDMGTVPYASSGGTHRLYLVSIIQLYKALGGGWSPEQAAIREQSSPSRD